MSKLGHLFLQVIHKASTPDGYLNLRYSLVLPSRPSSFHFQKWPFHFECKISLSTLTRPINPWLARLLRKWVYCWMPLILMPSLGPLCGNPELRDCLPQLVQETSKRNELPLCGLPRPLSFMKGQVSYNWNSQHRAIQRHLWIIWSCGIAGNVFHNLHTIINVSLVIFSGHC